MLLRLLFGLTTSLSSGLAVAFVLSIVVEHFFSDPTGFQHNSSISVAHQSARSAKAEASTAPPGSSTEPAALTGRVANTGATTARPTPEQDAGDLQAAGQSRHPEQPGTTQEASPGREQTLSASASAAVSAESHPDTVPSLPPTPDFAAQVVDVAGPAQPAAQISAQAETSDVRPSNGPGSLPASPVGRKSPEAAGPPARAAAESRSTRARRAARVAPHAEHAHRGHSTPRGTTAIAQHQK